MAKAGSLSKAQKQAFYDWVAAQPCLVCGGLSTIHHVTAHAHHKGRVSRRDDRVTPLCPIHHQVIFGPRESVEALGHGGFYRTYQIDLMQEAERLWSEWQSMAAIA